MAQQTFEIQNRNELLQRLPVVIQVIDQMDSTNKQINSLRASINSANQEIARLEAEAEPKEPSRANTALTSVFSFLVVAMVGEVAANALSQLILVTIARVSWLFLLYDILAVILYVVRLVGVPVLAIMAAIPKTREVLKCTASNFAELITGKDKKRQARIAELQTQVKGWQQEIANREAYRQQLQARWANECAPWYPREYSSCDAVHYIYDSIRLGKASSLGEAMNLYDEALHRSVSEKNQQQMINNTARVLDYEQANLEATCVMGAANIAATHAEGNRVANAVDRAGDRAVAAAANAANAVANSAVAAADAAASRVINSMR